VRIAIIRREYIDYVDGVNNFIFMLADSIASMGHEVMVLSHSAHAPIGPHDLRDTWDLKCQFGLKSLEVNEGHPSWGHMAVDWLTKGSKVLREFRPDGIVINGIVPLLVRSTKVAVIHGFRTSMAFVPSRRGGLYARIAKALYDRMDCIVCVSKRVLKEAADLGIECDQVIPIPIFVDRFVALPRRKRDNIVLQVGTRAVKNPLISVKAVERLVESGLEVKLVIVGPRTEAICSIERQFRSASWLEIMPPVSSKELRVLYSRSLAVIIPSQYEAFSYAALEAQASGTPVVVSGAVPDEVIMDGITGFKVNTFDPEQYARRLKMLIEGSRWESISANARKYAREFEATKIAGRYLEIIQRVGHHS
jgi:glycosyltransferase involved in cell wall biosynthesis